MFESEKIKFWEPAIYADLKKGTVLRHRFTETRIRYIFIEVEASGLIKVIPIYTRLNTGDEWSTGLLKMFAVAPKEEQIMEDWSTFDLQGFLKYCRTEIP